MEISVISFTGKGRECSIWIKKVLGSENRITLYCKAKRGEGENEDIRVCEESLSEWTQKQFERGNAIIFIGACGIAVRGIAACIKDKLEDVPVLVMDEAGRFVIPILSGHFGGANELAASISEKTGATAVITTATDINHKFAVDVFARKNSLFICNREGIKRISSAILAGEGVSVAIEGSFCGRIPEELTYVASKTDINPAENAGTSILISPFIRAGYQEALQLCPRAVVLGIGCRRGKSLEELEQAVQKQLSLLGIPFGAVAGIGSINIKKEERGLYELAEKYALTLCFFTEDELNRVEGAYTSSDFVKKQTGVDNICERSAVAAAGKGGSLILRKKAEGGITVAAAIMEWSVDFT